jgi:serine/threonine protein kinase/class 3 adenylate cyclase
MGPRRSLRRICRVPTRGLPALATRRIGRVAFRPPVMENSPPSAEQWLAHYRLIEKIGEGGMGVVYKAWDSRLERVVALKLLRDSLKHDQSRARLLREARLASSLNHPFIATIHDLEQMDGRDVIVMEFVQGPTLRQRLSRGPVELREALELTLAIADALGEAHAAGIVHRDIKPENIIITPQGYPKVMDFGLAKAVRPQSPHTSGEDRTTVLTDAGMVMGSVAYMSPEQAAGRDVAATGDVFALGLVLYEMLTRQPAFAGDSDVDILYGILHQEPRPISELNPDAPADVQAIVTRCTAKEPGERYPSGRELHQELRLARTTLDIQRARTLHTLLTVSQEMTSILDLEPLLERIARVVRSLIDYDVLGIFRLDAEHNRLVWIGGAGYVPERARATEYAADRGLCGRAIRTGQAIRVGDVTEDPEYYPPNGEAYRSNLAVPLMHMGQVTAVLNMESRRPHFFTNEHVTVMSTLAGLIAVAIANAHLFDEHRRHGVAMRTLHEIGHELSSILDLDRLLEHAGSLIQKIAEHDAFAIFLLDPQRGEFTWRAASGYDAELVRDKRFQLGEGAISRAVQLRRAVIVEDGANDPDFVPARTASGRDSRSELAVPLMLRDEILGVLTLESVEPGRFRPEQAELLSVLGSQIAVSIENARLYQRLHERAEAEKQEAERVRRRFESFVTPHIAEQVFRDPHGKTLAGERRPVTVLVADIRGFTRVAEVLPPEEVVKFLQEFFSLSSHLVFKYEGTVDKFVGDALMAFFGAPLAHDARYGPSDPQRAVFSAIDMRDAFRRLRDKWWERHVELAALDLSVGINTGEALLGNLGSDKRVEYTALGSAVNLAFRLCREAAPGEIRIGGKTHDDVRDEVSIGPLPEERAGEGPAHLVLGLKYIT